MSFARRSRRARASSLQALHQPHGAAHRAEDVWGLEPGRPDLDSSSTSSHRYFVSFNLKVKGKSLSHVWLFATPRTVAYLVPPSMGFSMARVVEWGAIAFSRGSSPPRDQIPVSHIAGSRFYRGSKFQFILMQMELLIPIWEAAVRIQCAKKRAWVQIIRFSKKRGSLPCALRQGCFGIYLCRCLRGFLGARLWAPLCLTPRLPHPRWTLPGTEGLGSRMSMRVWSTGTSGCSQNWERVLLFFRSSFSWQNLWALSGFWTGLKSLPPSSLTKFLLVRSNREGMMLGVQRGVHSSFGRKGATSDRSLMFFPKGTDMIGDEFRS